MLSYIKEVCSVTDDSFNTILLQYANLAISEVNQNYVINITEITETSKWEDLAVDNIEKLNFIKSYIGLKTRYLFDPPPNPTKEIIEKQLEQLLWRLGNYKEV